MEVRAKLKYLRISPKKVRLVANIVKGMDVLEALEQLKFISKSATNPLTKLINSAIANAENNFNLKKNNLYIKNILVDQGPTLHRWLPRAFGRATPLRKRSSHILVILDERVATKEAKKTVKKSKKEKVQTVDAIKSAPKREDVILNKKEKAAKDIEEKKDQEIFDVNREGKHRHKQHLDKKEKKLSKGFIKKVFNRKSG